METPKKPILKRFLGPCFIVIGLMVLAASAAFGHDNRMVYILCGLAIFISGITLL